MSGVLAPLRRGLPRGNVVLRAARLYSPRSELTTLPMLLTYARLGSIPVFAGCYLGAAPGAACAVFAAAAVTDALDGYLARRLNQQTALGATLDHVADKALVTAAFVCLGSAHGPVVQACGVLTVVREFAVSGLRELAPRASSGESTAAVDYAGKSKAAAQMLGLGCLLGSTGSQSDEGEERASGPWRAQLERCGLGLVVLSTGLGAVSGVRYAVRALPR